MKTQATMIDIQTLILMLSIILGQNRAFVFDMDVKLDSALQPGGALSRNKGSYLYDSFRTEVKMYISANN